MIPYIHKISYFDPMLLVKKIPHNKNFVFFDSASYGSVNGRFSFIAYDPFSIITAQNNCVLIDGITIEKPPAIVLSEVLSRFACAPNNLMPFTGGLAGYMGYEFIKYLDPKVKLLNKTNTQLPDLMMGIFDLVIGFDHVNKESWIYSSGLPEENDFLRKKRAEERCAQVLKILQLDDERTSSSAFVSKENISANLTYHQYCAAVEKVLGYIQAGDIYQANISQQFLCELSPELTPLIIYDRLRTKNPAPFSGYLNFNDTIIASASPERFISVNNGHVTTCPIKGTAKRSSNLIQDKQLAQALFHCEKNRAENLMIVDLMRNDLSKVCELFSVNVPKLFSIESYATVHHLVTTIHGKLKKDCDVIDLIRAAFPGGSITGAPKIRAMEIIDEIERQSRGPYCGSLGYFSFDGNMDTSIIIRTFVIKNQTLTFNVGGGIVADSTAHDEYIETLIKANALYKVLTNFDLKHNLN